MNKYVAAYAGTAIVMVALDMLWLGVIARPLYQQGIGHLMAERPVIPVAVLFYVLYAVGLTLFTIRPFAAQPGLGQTLIAAALFGFFAYATYDLTNQATLAVWQTKLTIIDLIWGTTLTMVSALGGYFAARGVGRKRG